MTGSILVTGGNGRLGRIVLALLGSRGVAGVRPGAATDAPAKLMIEDPSDLDPSQLAGFDAIINCAGQVAGPREALERANVAYPLALLRQAAAAGVSRFVQVSSFSVYGRVERIGVGSVPSPDSDYGRSKLAAEQALAALADGILRVTALRLPFMFSVVEPALFGRLVTTMMRVRVLPVPHSRVSRRSMITYAGAADALVTLATASDAPTGAIAAADPDPLELVAVAAALRERVGRRIVVVPVPAPLAALVRPLAPAMVDRLLRSSVLDPAANWLAAGSRYPVRTEAQLYLDRLSASGRS